MFACSEYTDQVDQIAVMLNFHPQLRSLSNAADFSALRHQVLSRNLANVNTPQYQREDVEVAVTAGSDPQRVQDFASAGLRIVKDQTAAVRADGNNVDIDAEIGALQQNAMSYQTIVQLMSSHLGLMRQAIDGT